MFTKWMMPLGLVASACLAVLVATAQDRGGKEIGTKDTGAGTRDTGRAGAETGIFTGRITRVDTDKRSIELNDARPTAGGTGKAVGTEPGPFGRRDTAGSAKDAARADTKDAGSKAIGGVAAGRTMTFSLSERARITLDGKEATLRDVRLNAYARVYTTAAGTDKDAGRAGTRDTAGRTKDAGSKGTGAGVTATMTAERVEVFTRDPGTSGDRTGGTRDRGSLTDKDR
jgi:hypothetical protein